MLRRPVSGLSPSTPVPQSPDQGRRPRSLLKEERRRPRTTDEDKDPNTGGVRFETKALVWRREDVSVNTTENPGWT